MDRLTETANPRQRGEYAAGLVVEAGAGVNDLQVDGNVFESVPFAGEFAAVGVNTFSIRKPGSNSFVGIGLGGYQAAD